MKKVAGFHCFFGRDVELIFRGLDFLNAFGMMDCHIDGEADRGIDSATVA